TLLPVLASAATPSATETVSNRGAIASLSRLSSREVLSTTIASPPRSSLPPVLPRANGFPPSPLLFFMNAGLGQFACNSTILRVELVDERFHSPVQFVPIQ
ncbi:hypothetical protein VIGAN_09034500, partial [Vigna angularis var. angularis]